MFCFCVKQHYIVVFMDVVLLYKYICLQDFLLSIAFIWLFLNKEKFFELDIYSFIICICFFGVRIPLFSHIQRWDGNVYYGQIVKAINELEFSFAHIWDTFRLSGHTSILYTVFMSLVEFLTLGDPIGINAVTAIMTSAAMVCLYKIFLIWISPKDNEAFKNILIF